MMLLTQKAPKILPGPPQANGVEELMSQYYLITSALGNYNIMLLKVL